MPEHEVRGDRAVYDIETEDPRGARRRRPAADWGVSEEIFDRMPSPRRRFRSSDAPAPRRESHPREAREVHDVHEAEEPRARRFEPARERQAPREDERPRRRDLGVVREAAAREVAAREEALLEPTREFVLTQDVPAAEPGGREALRSEARSEVRRDTARAARGGSPRGGIEGRRTVVISGQASPARRRPAPSVPERIGPRPDRLAAYAVALGLLLIIIALLSQ
jgi:hypothetical protein